MSDTSVSSRPWWLQAPYPFWFVLTIPAIAEVAYASLVPGAGIYTRNTGLMSCWLLILSLAITPLSYLFGPVGWIRWLRAQRRYIGVASFFYALMHLAIFLKDHSRDFWPSFQNVNFLTGWAGLAILAVMAWTSRDSSIRRMGRAWKPVQQLVYIASPLIVFHWWVFPKHTLEVAIYTVPLLVLTIWRVFFRRRRRGGDVG